MTVEPTTASREWTVDTTGAGPDGPQATVSGAGHRFVLRTTEGAEALADILNAQTGALVEAAQFARRYDCGKTSLQKAAMVPCLNLPKGAACYACELTKARFERNSYCICDDDDELPTGPADYCPVHGNTYKYVHQEQARLVEAQRARDAASERAEAAEARAARYEEALRRLAGLSGEPAQAFSEVARSALEA
jgi:hypothetical protein